MKIRSLELSGFRLEKIEEAPARSPLAFPSEAVESKTPSAPETAPSGKYGTQQDPDESPRGLSQDEMRLREDQLAQMLIEDPERFEKLLMQGDLQSDAGPGDDEELNS